MPARIPALIPTQPLKIHTNVVGADGLAALGVRREKGLDLVLEVVVDCYAFCFFFFFNDCWQKKKRSGKGGGFEREEDEGYMVVWMREGKGREGKGRGVDGWREEEPRKERGMEEASSDFFFSGQEREEV